MKGCWIYSSVEKQVFAAFMMDIVAESKQHGRSTNKVKEQDSWYRQGNQLL